MIRTLTLNPAVDRRVVIEGFAVDRVNRVRSASAVAGGKGINVSKAVRALGGVSRAYGFVGGNAGAFIRGYLDERGIGHRLVEIDGETRTNIKVVDPVSRTHTDINEAGPAVSPAALARLEAELFADLGRDDLLVLSGSAPAGCGAGLYGAWIARARRAGARVLLDAEGELLRLGIEAGPTLAKPNLHELEGLLGRSLDGLPSMIQALRSLVAAQGSTFVLTLGEGGALFVDPQMVLHAGALPVEAASTVGAGDSMLAAIALCLERGEDLTALVAPAIAAASAAVASGGSGDIDPETVRHFEKNVRWEKL